MQALREAVGLRDLSIAPAVDKTATRRKSMAVPVFKQYREADGKFYFKLGEDDRVLLQSQGYDAPRDAGQQVAALKAGRCDDATLSAWLVGDATLEDVRDALARIAEAEADKAAHA